MENKESKYHIKNKIYKAEASDCIHYYNSKIQEPFMHFYIEFDSHLSLEVLTKAVTLSTDAEPIFRSCFKIIKNRPYWEDKGFTGEDIVFVFDAESNKEDQINKLLSTKIDIFNEPQIKIILIKGETSDSLCIIINHMVADGSGAKEYLSVLCDLYSKILNGEEIEKPKSFTRDIREIYKGLKTHNRFNILNAKFDISKLKNKLAINFEGDENSAFFVFRSIDESNLRLLKEYSKNKDVTLNDIIMTGFLRLLSKELNADRIILPCPIDLRKYLNDNQKIGICNLTSHLVCDVKVKGNDSFDKTLKKVSKQIKLQKDNMSSLPLLLILDFANKVLHFNFMNKHFGKYLPALSYTNVGVIDKEQFKFANSDIKDIYIFGAVKYNPYFQLTVSTFNDKCTFTCAMHGTKNDKKWIENFLDSLVKELLNRR